MGSSYVVQFNKFGRTFQVYVQADAQFRLRRGHRQDQRAQPAGRHGAARHARDRSRPTVGPSLINLYNLYPSATIIGLPARGFSSGQAMALMEQIADQTLPPGIGFEWTAMSYQEKIVGGQIYIAFGLGAAARLSRARRSIRELVRAALRSCCRCRWRWSGRCRCSTGVGVDNNLYVQIGLILLIALSAKNAILIVEVAREMRVLHGHPILQSAVEAARARFRPILMTSFAFILGVAPLVVATGAGASARKSIGITVFSGMIASTCLAVLFVPAVRRDPALRGVAGERQGQGRSDAASRPPAGAPSATAQVRRSAIVPWRTSGQSCSVHVSDRRATDEDPMSLGTGQATCAAATFNRPTPHAVIWFADGLATRYTLTIRLPRFSAGEQADQRLRRVLHVRRSRPPAPSISPTRPRTAGRPAPASRSSIESIAVKPCMIEPLYHDQAGRAARAGRRRHAVVSARSRRGRRCGRGCSSATMRASRMSPPTIVGAGIDPASAPLTAAP